MVRNIDTAQCDLKFLCALYDPPCGVFIDSATDMRLLTFVITLSFVTYLLGLRWELYKDMVEESIGLNRFIEHY